VLLLILMVLLGFLSAGPASAETTLVDSTPVDGKNLTAAPGRVSLTFSDGVLKLGATITVNGPDGAVGAGVAKISDKKVSWPLVGDLAAGQYAVRWQVTAQDGQPLAGTLRFAVRAPVESTGSPPVPAQSAGPTTAPNPTTHSAMPEMTGAMPGMVGMPGPTTQPAQPNSGSTTALAIAGLVLLTAIVVGAIAIERRRRPQPSAADPSETATD
jgi:methionine-rich copper-binding protein CopC